MSANQKLTPKRAAFVEEFACDMNATQAAIRAGYSVKTAKEQATRLLSNVHVAAEIAKGRAARSERTGITAERILAELARIAFFDVRKLLNDDGSMKPISEIDDDTRAGIAGLELSEIRDEDGKPHWHAEKDQDRRQARRARQAGAQLRALAGQAENQRRRGESAHAAHYENSGVGNSSCHRR